MKFDTDNLQLFFQSKKDKRNVLPFEQLSNKEQQVTELGPDELLEQLIIFDLLEKQKR